MSLTTNESNTENQKSKASTKGINLILFLVVFFLLFFVAKKYYSQVFRTEPSTTKQKSYQIFEYNEPAQFGFDLNHLVPFDINPPLQPGLYLKMGTGGELLFETPEGVEIKMTTGSFILLRPDGLQILEGQITLQTKRGSLPEGFKVFDQEKPLAVLSNPATLP